MKKMILSIALTAALPAIATVGTEMQHFNFKATFLSEFFGLNNAVSMAESAPETTPPPPTNLKLVSVEASTEPSSGQVTNKAGTTEEK